MAPTKPPRAWTVTPHGPLVQHAPHLWSVESPVPGIPGGSFPRRMMVVRLSDGSLLLHNGVPLDDAGLALLRDLGRPSILVIPNAFHCIDAHAVRERLGLRVLCPAACAAQVGSVVQVDGHLDALPADPRLRFVPLDGTRNGEGVLFVADGSGAAASLLVGDCLLNVPHLPGFWGLVWRLAGFTGDARCGPVWLKRAVADRRALRASLERVAAEPGLARIVPSHGPVIDRDPAGALRAAAARLG